MSFGAANPIQLDLVAHHCSHVVLFATITPDQNKVESLRELVPTARQSQAWPWFFAQTYRVASRWYSAEALIHPARQTGALDLQIEFSPGRDARRRAGSVLSMLDVVSDPSTVVAVRCVAHFDYGENEGVSTIPLPVGGPESVALPDGPNARFEIRGLRIAQLDEEGSVDFSIIVDRPTNAEFHHTVSFERASILSADLPGQLLDRASEMSSWLFRVTEESRKRVSTAERST